MDMSLVQLREELADAHAEFQASADAVKNAPEDVTLEDLNGLKATFEAAEVKYSDAKQAHKDGEARAESARQRFELQQRAEDAQRVPTPAQAQASVTREPLTYTRGGEHGFFRDLFRRDVANDPAAAERLARHQREMIVERQEKYDLSSTDSAGGYLVAPVWLNEQFVDIAKAGRVVANTIGSRPLPANTDSINLPTLSTGTAVAVQADGGAVTETDAVFSTVAGAVKTIAGMQDVSQQLVDRSIPGVDEVIFADLAKEYALTLDTAVINSSTASNLGLLQVSGINSVTYTDASPTVAELYPKIANAISQVHTGVFLPPNAIFMHPRRWAWILSGVDGNLRPLVTPYAPQNAAGDHGGVVSEGLVGSIQGLPVYVDANIPATTGTGTNQDSILVVRTDECFLYEDLSGPYLETFRDVGSGTLTVRFRLHNYYAQINARRPTAISAITGTGLVAPTF